MDLVTCLHGTPKRLLVGVALAYGLRDPYHLPKDRLAQDLADTIADPANLAHHLASLALPGLAALRTLAAVGGRMSQTDFCAAFGVVRPYGTPRYAGPRHPWRSPISIAEMLLYRGLIFFLAAPDSSQSGPVVVLPEELRTRLVSAPTDASHSPPLPEATQPHPTAIVADLALFLAYLQTHFVLPLHGRWLSLRHCRTLAPCLTLPSLDPAARSELSSGRLAFLHFLADSLDLVHTIGRRLQPTPTALDWLRQPLATQRHALCTAWLSPAEHHRQLWRRYRLPGHALRDPHAFAQRVLNLLASLPPPAPLTASALLQAPTLLADSVLPWWERETTDRPSTLVHDLLAGPLTWLGLLEDAPAAGSDSAWQRTAWAEWLLGLRPDAPGHAPRQPLTLQPDLALAVTPEAQPASLLALAPWAELVPGPALRLTPASIIAALAGGATLPDLFAALAVHAAPALAPDQRATITHWAERAVVRIRPALVLDQAPAAVLDALRADPRTRACVSQRLSPTSALVDPTELDRAIRLLRLRGLAVDLASAQAAATTPSVGALSAGDAAWLAVALTVYSALARRLPDLAPPPAAALDTLRPVLTPAAWAAVQTAAAQAIAAVAAAIDDPRPRAPEAGRGELADRLAQAAEAGEMLTLRYWSPWTQESTERIVKPLYLTWRGDHAYLVAFCHLRQAERSFRLDRIQSVGNPISET